MGGLESFGDSSSDVNEQALAAVAEFVQSIDDTKSDMVQRFVLLVETIDEDDRWLSAFTAPGQKAWDTLGLLEFGRSMEWSARQLDDDGDDT